MDVTEELMTILFFDDHKMLTMQQGGEMTSQQYLNQIKAYLSRQFSLEDHQINEMLPSFISTLSGHMKNLETAFSSGDLEVLGRSGHKIKGAFLNLGLNDCAEIALQIERKGKSKDQSADYRKLVTDLRQKVDLIIQNNL